MSQAESISDLDDIDCSCLQHFYPASTLPLHTLPSGNLLFPVQTVTTKLLCDCGLGESRWPRQM